MGQKINPTGFRLPVTHDWTSRWYATGRDFARTLAEDLKVRDYLGKKLKNASVVFLSSVPLRTLASQFSPLVRAL